MKRIKTTGGGPPSFDREDVPGEYDPDAVLADKPDSHEDYLCEVCGEKKVRTGDGWTCPNCQAVIESGEME